MTYPPPSSRLIRLLLETKYVRHYARRIIKTYKTKVDDGLTIYVRMRTNDEIILREIFERRLYEKYFAALEGEVVADIGAHSGCFTLRASRLVGPSGRVLAFEPTSGSFSLLQRHLKVNKCLNATAFRVALGSKPGTATLNIFRNPSDNSLFDRRPRTQWGDVRRVGTEEVRVETLDSLIGRSNLNRVDILKIDTEGSELDILEGAVNVLEQFHPKIVAETHSWVAPAEAVDNFLIKRGYTTRVESTSPIAGLGLLYAW